MMSGFAVIAVVIATMGLYAIMGYAVASRTREFGVRLALGASASSLVMLVLREGFRIAAWGIVIGAVGAVGTTRVMRSMLFRVDPGDPLTRGIVCVGICLLA